MLSRKTFYLALNILPWSLSGHMSEPEHEPPKEKRRYNRRRKQEMTLSDNTPYSVALLIEQGKIGDALKIILQADGVTLVNVQKEG